MMKYRFILLLLLLLSPIFEMSADDTIPTKDNISKENDTKNNHNKSKSKFSLGIFSNSSDNKEDSLPIYRSQAEDLGVINQKRQDSIADYKKQLTRFKQLNDSLTDEITKRDSIISSQIVASFGQQLKDAPPFFCRAVMESPLYYKYESNHIKMSKALSEALGFNEKSHKLFFIYNAFYDLLENYQLYNQELIDNINKIIEQFSIGAIDREFERGRFEDRLQNSKYYSVRGKGQYGSYRHIFYLDFRIEQIRDLFKNDTNFKKAKFIEIRDAL